MLSNRFTKTVCAAALLALAAGCATAPKPKELPPEKEFPPVPEEVAAIYSHALSLQRDGALEEAAAALKNFSQRFPEYSGPYVNLAIIYRQQGRIDDAHAAVDTALEIRGDNAAAYNQRGILAREAGDFEAAEAAYKAAIEANPRYPNAYLNLGILEDLYRHNPRGALKLYREYAELVGEENLDRTVQGWIADTERRAR